MVLVVVGVGVMVGGVVGYMNDVRCGGMGEKGGESVGGGMKRVMGREEVEVGEGEEVKEEFGGKELCLMMEKWCEKRGKEVGGGVESRRGGLGGDVKVVVGLDRDGKIMGYRVVEG